MARIDSGSCPIDKSGADTLFLAFNYQLINISIMSLQNSPYLPLYVKDFMSDEKLSECSASANGVYIRLMCMLHKSEPYGKILLKEKYKTDSNACMNFASMLARHMPYTVKEICEGLTELLYNEVVYIVGDYLFQPRMVKLGEISEKRAVAGKKGGEKTFCSSKTKSKIEANEKIEEDVEKDKEVKKFSFLKELVGLGVDRKIAEEWIKVRKNKKLTQTETAFNKLKDEIDRSGMSANDCITLCVERSWGGFKAEWVEREVKSNMQGSFAKQNNHNDDWQL